MTSDMKPQSTRFRALTAILLTAAALAHSRKRVWNFDANAVGKLPANFTSALTGHGTLGDWEVMKDDSAPSPPNVLAQASADPD
jgi:hypothetical protein